MKNIFSSDDEKLTEKAFWQGLLVSVFSIFLCIIALCSMTYAWFREDLKSKTNNIQSGHFSVNIDSVLLIVDDELSTSSETTTFPNDDGIYTLDEGTYKISLQPTPETNVKGYCIVTINDTEYRTDVIVNDNSISESYPTPNTPFVFYLKLSETSTFKIKSKWGIPVEPIIVNEYVIDITVSSPDSDETTAEE